MFPGSVHVFFLVWRLQPHRNCALSEGATHLPKGPIYDISNPNCEMVSPCLHGPETRDWLEGSAPVGHLHACYQLTIKASIDRARLLDRHHNFPRGEVCRHTIGTRLITRGKSISVTSPGNGASCSFAEDHCTRTGKPVVYIKLSCLRV